MHFITSHWQRPEEGGIPAAVENNRLSTHKIHWLSTSAADHWELTTPECNVRANLLCQK